MRDMSSFSCGVQPEDSDGINQPLHLFLLVVWRWKRHICFKPFYYLGGKVAV